MSTQPLMKGLTAKAERPMRTEGAGIERMHSSFGKTKQGASPGGRISPAFDLRLIINSSRSAFVSLFVVLGVYYPAIIVSGGRQTRVGWLHPAKANKPNRKRATMLVGRGAFVSSAGRVITGGRDRRSSPSSGREQLKVVFSLRYHAKYPPEPLLVDSRQYFQGHVIRLTTLTCGRLLMEQPAGRSALPWGKLQRQASWQGQGPR